jgi:hypothetical protein
MPRARLWSWLIGCTGPLQRTTIISPAIQTPCVVWEINTNWPQGPSGAGGLSLLYSTDDAGAQTNGPATKPSGTPVFEPDGFRSAVVVEADTIPEHLPMVGEGGTVSLPLRIQFRKLIEVAGPVFFKLSLQAGAGEVRIRGVLVFLEGDSVEQLANFS